MAGTIPTTAQQMRAPIIAILRAQLLALETMYASERRCDNARRILDLIHEKRDQIAVEQLAIDRADLELMREVAA